MYEQTGQLNYAIILRVGTLYRLFYTVWFVILYVHLLLYGILKCIIT